MSGGGTFCPVSSDSPTWAERVDAIRKSLKLSRSEVARRAGRSRQWLHEALQSNDPHISTVTTIASALGVEPGALLNTEAEA